jgi:hypothetical protein
MRAITSVALCVSIVIGTMVAARRSQPNFLKSVTNAKEGTQPVHDSHRGRIKGLRRIHHGPTKLLRRHA